MGRQVAGCQLWLNPFLMPGTAVGSTDKVAAPGQLLPVPEGWCSQRTIRPAKARQLQPIGWVLWLERFELPTAQGHH